MKTAFRWGETVMMVSVDLSQQEWVTLEARAREQGVDMETVLHRLIAGISPPRPDLTEQQRSLLALLEQWDLEDATEDPDELVKRDQELQEFKRAMNRSRADEWREPAFPRGSLSSWTPRLSAC